MGLTIPPGVGLAPDTSEESPGMNVTDEFLDYYNRELIFLREMGNQFATSNPQVAGLLALEAGRCGDPHVERLMQAFAFLAARIRKKLDDEYPEITDALLSVVYPHYQRPIPSLTVVQFQGSPDPTKSVAGQRIPRATPLKASVSIDGVRCQFQTAYPVTLWPINVVSAVLIQDRIVLEGKPSDAVALLRVGLNCTAPGGWESLQGCASLRFFLDGHEPIPSILYECLFSRVCEVWVQGTSATGAVIRNILPRGAIRPVGFELDEALWPYPEPSFPGYRLLQEFFAFPAKFLFFDLELNDPKPGGGNPIRSAGMVGPIQLMFWLDQPPRSEVVVRPDNLRLGCTPAVNLFRKVPEPIPLNQLQTEYAIVPDVDHPAGYEVFSVDRVASSGDPFLYKAYDFEPFYAMKHASRDPARGAYWFARRQPSLRDEGTDVVLSFTDPQFNPAAPAAETITVNVTCSNRNVPSGLPFGGEQSYLESDTEVAAGRGRILIKPTAPLYPPLGRSSQWRLISQLGLNHLSLLTTEQGAEALQELLSLYDFADTATTRKMIGGILTVSHSRIAGRVVFPATASDPRGAGSGSPNPRDALKGKPLSLGLKIRLDFDENAFSGAMAFVMASVLDRFFGAYVSINAFTQLVATSKQRQGIWQWPTRSGARTLV
jgi:type VI secretion system protein ImpG